jgi:cyclophilin family peptidyl-prolyl cis-trans isomerase
MLDLCMQRHHRLSRGGASRGRGAPHISLSGGGEAEPRRDPCAAAAGERFVACETTAGPLDICVQPTRAQLGAARFLDMARDDTFFLDAPFFRTVTNFIAQTGIPGDPAVSARWREIGSIADDTPGGHLRRGELSFAGGGKDTRGTQFFITFNDSRHLGDAPWEVAFGYVTEETMAETADHLNTEYGEMYGFNDKGVKQGRIEREGAAYIRHDFPRMSLWKGCRVVPPRDEREAEAAAKRRADAAAGVWRSSGVASPSAEQRLGEEEVAAPAPRILGILPSPKKAPGLYVGVGFGLTLMAFACGSGGYFGGGRARGRSSATKMK